MRTWWFLATVFLSIAGCGTEEEAVDRDASAAETEEVVDPVIVDVISADDPEADDSLNDLSGADTASETACETVVDRFREYTNQNSSCSEDADCESITWGDCGGWYPGAVRSSKVDGAQQLLTEMTACGISLCSVFECVYDGAPPLVVSCRPTAEGGGRCSASPEGSCLDRDTGWGSDADTSDDPDITVDDCTTVEARWNAYVESNNQCETAADCQIYVSREDCGCSYASSVNSAAVDGATALQAEAERCGLTPETVLGCVADAAPGMSLGCSGGRCRVGWPDSCFDYFDVGPDEPFEPDVWSEDDVVPPDADDGSGADAP
jgi:hypothetical protein